MDAQTSGRILRAGDPVVFVDPRNRSYFALLQEGGRTDVRGHQFPHDAIIGNPEGFTMRSTRGMLFQVLRPTLAEYVTRMPRTQTIIYPKDIGTILVWGDIHPGAKVMEAGIGTGALAIALLQAIGPSGRLISCDVRQDAINRARKNIVNWMGEPANHEIRLQDVYEGIEERDLDRLVLDVPEPWQVVPHAAEALRDGGVIVCYSPTVIQVQSTVEALHRSRAFTAVETWESLHRPWHVTRESVRPELQMIGHTGFLTFARKARRIPDESLPEPGAPPPEGEETPMDAPQQEGAPPNTSEPEPL